jgi:hypothetical protein
MKCPYCKRLGEPCCDPKAIVKKSKDVCFICNEAIFDKEPTFYERLAQMCQFGNCCRKCNNSIDEKMVKQSYQKVINTP